MSMNTSPALCVANWKMFQREVDVWIHDVENYMRGHPVHARVVLCPQMLLVSRACQSVVHSSISIGAQDCHAYDEGAYTGFSSPKLLSDMGCRYVILGHSERRYMETDECIHAKAKAAQKHHLIPILCVGEPESVRKSSRHLDYVQHQIYASCRDLHADFVIAYEPLWAIGTGLIPTPKDIEIMHDYIAQCLCQMGYDHHVPILYGGSVNSQNIQSIIPIPGVQGVLVGGASLNSTSFISLLKSVESHAVI